MFATLEYQPSLYSLVSLPPDSHSPSCPCAVGIFTSQYSKTMQAQSATMANTAAMTGMTSAIQYAMDCISGLKDSLSASTVSPPMAVISPATSSLTSSETLSIMHHASQMLLMDQALDPAVCDQLACAFLNGKSLCQMYVDLTDPLVRQSFIMNWFQQHCGPLLSSNPTPTSSISNTSSQPVHKMGTSMSLFSDQSKFVERMESNAVPYTGYYHSANMLYFDPSFQSE